MSNIDPFGTRRRLLASIFARRLLRIQEDDRATVRQKRQALKNTAGPVRITATSEASTSCHKTDRERASYCNETKYLREKYEEHRTPSIAKKEVTARSTAKICEM